MTIEEGATNICFLDPVGEDSLLQGQIAWKALQPYPHPLEQAKGYM